VDSLQSQLKEAEKFIEFYGDKEKCNKTMSKQSDDIELLQSQLKEAEKVIEKNLEELNWAYMALKDKLKFGLPEEQAVYRRELRVKGVLITTRETAREYLKKWRN